MSNTAKPLVVDERTIAYAVMGAAYAAANTDLPHLIPTYQADRAALQALLESWDK